MHVLMKVLSDNMVQLLIILHVLIALALIGLVFMQQGKGSDIGASFGSGGSNTVFGSQGSLSFLFKLTAFLAVIFFVNSIVLNHWFASHTSQVLSPAPSAAVPQQQPTQGMPGAGALPGVPDKP